MFDKKRKRLQQVEDFKIKPSVIVKALKLFDGSLVNLLWDTLTWSDPNEALDYYLFILQREDHHS